MQAQAHVLRVARPGIDIRCTQAFIPRQVVDVLRRIRKVGQARESFFGCAQRFDHGRTLHDFHDAKLPE